MRWWAMKDYERGGLVHASQVEKKGSVTSLTNQPGCCSGVPEMVQVVLELTPGVAVLLSVVSHTDLVVTTPVQNA